MQRGTVRPCVRWIAALGVAVVTACAGASLPTLVLFPTSVAFEAVTGAPDPEPRKVNVLLAGAADASGLTVGVVYAGAVQGWLSVSPSGTELPATLTLTVSMAGVPSGSHAATVSVSVPNASSSPQAIAVSLTVSTTFGFAEELPEDSDHSPGALLGSAVEVPQRAELTHVGIVGRAAGPRVRIGIYDDDGGRPGALLAEVNATLDGERQEFPVIPTVLEPGTYWFMAVYDAEASVGQASVPGAEYRFIVHPFAAALPSSWPSEDLAQTGTVFNYYLRVRLM
jgi:hypothetical protein